MYNNKITKNIEVIMARHDNAQDCAKTLRRQMATTRPMVTFNQLVTEQAIACGRKEFEYAKDLALIFSAMLDQEMKDSGHSRAVCQAYLQNNIAVGRIKIATMSEVYRSYTDGACPTAGKPFARINIMGKTRDALEVLADMSSDAAVSAAAKADSIEISEKLAAFAGMFRLHQGEVGTDEAILTCADADYEGASC